MVSWTRMGTENRVSLWLLRSGPLQPPCMKPVVSRHHEFDHGTDDRVVIAGNALLQQKLTVLADSIFGRCRIPLFARRRVPLGWQRHHLRRFDPVVLNEDRTTIVELFSDPLHLAVQDIAPRGQEVGDQIPDPATYS